MIFKISFLERQEDGYGRNRHLHEHMGGLQP